MPSELPSRLILVAGTYDGGICGWDTTKTIDTNDSNTTTATGLDNNNDNDDDNEDPTVKSQKDDDDDDNNNEWLKMAFAMPTHDGSVRCLSLSNVSGTTRNNNKHKHNNNDNDNDNDNDTIHTRNVPGQLLTGGYDESLKVFDLNRRRETGVTQTPSDLGTPTCSSFAPPPPSTESTHAVVGTSEGHLILYETSPGGGGGGGGGGDHHWRIVHVLSPPPLHKSQPLKKKKKSNSSSKQQQRQQQKHNVDAGPVTCLAVHPSGSLMLSGHAYGVLRLWDLTRGKLSATVRVGNDDDDDDNDDHEPPTITRATAVGSLAWSPNGAAYAYTYGQTLVVTATVEGQCLLRTELEGRNARIHQMCFFSSSSSSSSSPNDNDNDNNNNENENNRPLCLCCACDDGSLPVFGIFGEDDVRAVMAIEPVDRSVAGGDRIKCVVSLSSSSSSSSSSDSYLVATANSAGIISVMDLEGAVRMMTMDDNDNDDDNEDLRAVEIIQSVRVGTGARITGLVAWRSVESRPPPAVLVNRNVHKDDNDDDTPLSVSAGPQRQVPLPTVDTSEEGGTAKKGPRAKGKKGRGPHDNENTNHTKDPEATLADARKLVEQAKKRQRRKKRKKTNNHS